MSNYNIGRRVLVGVTVLLLLILWPLIVVVVMSGFLLGLFAAGGFLVFAGAAPILDRVQRYFRNRRAALVSTTIPRTRQIASKLDVPMVDSVRAPEKPIEIIVRLVEGGCPLLRETGDVIKVSSLGELSTPLCSPSAAAVQRLMRDKGLESGTTARCVCPIGPYELTFALDAA